MAKIKLITLRELKTELKNLTNEELISLVTDITKACPQAKQFLTIKFAAKDNIESILEHYKEKVEHEFYPKRGHGRLNLRTAKNAISDFKKISPNKDLEIDLMLFYVENCVRFSDDYGDISESFYLSAESMFEKVIKMVNSCGEETYNKFSERLKWATDNATHGWGFHDTMIHFYYELNWVDDDYE